MNAVAMPDADMLSSMPTPAIVVNITMPARTLTSMSEKAMMMVSTTMFESLLRNEPYANMIAIEVESE